MKRVCMIFTGSVIAIGATAMADPSTQPAVMPSDLSALQGRPDESPATQPVLGPVFSSKANGISLQPPAGGKTIRQNNGDVIVDFINEPKKTLLRVTRTTLARPIQLSMSDDRPLSTTNPADRPKGMLELTANQLVARMPNSKILRQDVMPLASHNAGMLMVRATNGINHELIQQVVLQANEQLYYNITYSSPGESFDAPPDKPSATELEAVRTFQAVLDTVALTDLEKLHEDQVDRLYRTRSLLVNWTETKLRSVLVAEQWVRVIRDGKDIGYKYIVEEPEGRGATPGIKIGIRSRTVPEAGKQTDSETWYHLSFDRKIENWSNISLFTGGDEKYHVTEFGSSEQRRKPVADRAAVDSPLNGPDAGPSPATQRSFHGENVGIKLVDDYKLSVHRVSKRATLPDVQRALPPYYLPQALGYLLPRLLPTNEPRGYLFASYVSGEGEVMLRYIDVGPLTESTLNGQKITAFPITDRFGPDAPPTTHYIDPTGKYLGSESVFTNDDGVKSTLLVLPTDPATLVGIWGNATLTRPSDNPVVPRD